ncbi:sodium/calcium exchanger NCL1-like [Carica papaya]|uniref:sodium/calcium exchanger NCL1-like n=1 Tax=Carica papaya TaxID=3649 RepID=UPI000B8D0A91|nr:sodium/calcium exchanger NCL1-like [Carica papaya]
MPSGDVNLGGYEIRCQSVYGFLPCTNKLWGQVFLIVVYEYLLSLSDAYIANGSELFFKMFGTGFFGASLFQMLGMIPRVALILVAGVSGTKENIQAMAAMGMGLLAGSVMMSLTLIWGSIVIFGHYDILPNSQKNKSFNLTGYGVTTDIETTYMARIILLTMIPFLILGVAELVASPSGTRVLFEKMDKNGDRYISTEELEAFILGLQIQEVGLCEKDFVSKMMEEFDVTGDFHICELEFIHGLSRWLHKANTYETSEELQSLLPRGPRTYYVVKKYETCWNYIKAAFFVIFGISMAILLARPLMQSIQEFSNEVGIPSFLVSYALIPLGLSCRQAVRAISTANEKTENAVSLTFSQLYGGVFMNNIMGLAIFLALVYIRDIQWDVSAELLVVLVICTAMGFFSSFNRKFALWTGIVAFLLYPISLAMLYILTHIMNLP